MKVKKGDLVHIPASTTLKKHVNDNPQEEVQRWAVIETPKAILVVEERPDHYEVLYNGEKWFVKRSEIFLME